ncbi:MAG: ferredoxin/flavodoxin---NADP+ reductase, partial [Thermoleophilaceae bacterium]|nr:ferredoxin/flavodoxin---NADP+ reductase [Thermoleophilaceae bacterium]
ELGQGGGAVLRGQGLSDAPKRVAVVGAGPAGFYACEDLLKAGFEVDLYDALPTPFGLVRAGVAPDHPKIKSVTRRYEKTAAQPGFRFFGGVELGSDIERSDLFERYHAVVYAVGTSADNRLGIEGEDRPGSHAATEFVAWYNGHPDYADHSFDLSATRAVVIGNGNVAIDVARMLVLDPDEISITDTADHAIDDLAKAQVEHVIILGRRGPAQAAFTNPELLELGELKRSDVIVHPEEIELDEHSARWLEEHGDKTARRNVEILRDYSQREPTNKSHRIELRFLRSPLELLGDDGGGPVSGIRVVRNRIEPDAQGNLRAVATGEEEVIDCGLVVRSIGYRGQPLPGVPFDERRGLIRNEGGRVTDDEGAPVPGEYVVGWIKRGPSGVIGTNKKDASDTVARVLEDVEAGRLNEPQTADGEEVEAWLRSVVPGLVTWNGWQAIDRHETSLGEPHNRPRVKVVRVPEMIAIAERG